MKRQWRKTVPWTLFALLSLLFGVALPLSFNVLTTSASNGYGDPYAIRVSNPLYSLLDLVREAESKLDPQDQIIIPLLPTPTRTPTPINIGNFVWDDLDKDGRQDAGEPGLSGITVQLWNSTKTQMIDSAVTNASGIYAVTAPLPGNYRIRVILPGPADTFSPRDQAGGDNQLDSDIISEISSLSHGFTATFSLASNVISTTIMDAGIIVYRPPTPTRTPTPINIGNFVWNDVNANGVQDAGEKGLNGIVVQLWNADKTQLVSSAVTNTNGNYSVVAPVPGDYRIRVLKPAGSSYSPSNQGGDDLKDSDVVNSLVASNAGFSGIFTLGVNVISTTIWDAGLYNVPATPTYTVSPTKTLTPTQTITTVPASNSDTIALYSKEKTKFAFVDTLFHPAPLSSITKVNSSAPVNGKFVMGDWNNDGQATPGLFKAGMFWYTNTISGSAVWSNVWMGEYNKPFVVAGRFSAGMPNDCFGVVEREHSLPGDGFPLYYTCELLVPLPPSGIQNQFLAVTLPGTGGYHMVAGDWDGDGLDTIAVRRDNLIAWGDVGPEEGVGTFPLVQDFGDPFDGYGDIVAGDWNDDGIDTFGLFFKQKGRFYYRNDLSPSIAPYLVQKIGKPIGLVVKPFSWRETVEIRSEGNEEDGNVLPLPGTPVNGMPAVATLTPSMPPEVFATQTPEAPSATPEQQTLDTATATFADVTPTMTPTPFYFPTSTLAIEPTDAGDSTD